MKIVTYRVPVDLTRDSTGQVSMSLKDDNKALVQEQDLGPNTKDIVSLSAEIGQHNSKQMEIAKMILGAAEDSKSTFIQLKYLQ